MLPVSELERIACHGVGVMSILEESGAEASSSDIAMCESIANQCISSDADLQLMIDASCESATTDSTFGDCDATVADYERCADRILSLLRTQLRGMSCDLLANPEEIEEATSLEVDVSNDAACSAVRTKCPDVDLGFASDDEDLGADG